MDLNNFPAILKGIKTPLTFGAFIFGLALFGLFKLLEKLHPEQVDTISWIILLIIFFIVAATFFLLFSKVEDRAYKFFIPSILSIFLFISLYLVMISVVAPVPPPLPDLIHLRGKVSFGSNGQPITNGTVSIFETNRPINSEGFFEISVSQSDATDIIVKATVDGLKLNESFSLREFERNYKILTLHKPGFYARRNLSSGYCILNVQNDLNEISIRSNPNISDYEGNIMREIDVRGHRLVNSIQKDNPIKLSDIEADSCTY